MQRRICGILGSLINHFIANLLPSPMVKEFLKIGQHLAKLRTKVESRVFWTHGVEMTLHTRLLGVANSL